MARSWRIEYEGAYYHLLSRGNERRDIFLCDEDRNLVLDKIGECGERFEIDIFSYVLMSNHYHLLLRTHRANLSKAMQWFSGTYTRRFNNRHGRSGHLWIKGRVEGRSSATFSRHFVARDYSEKQNWQRISPPSSIRACGFPAHGFPMSFTVRHA